MWKRKHLPTLTVLLYIRTYDMSAFSVLCNVYPRNVVLAAYMRDERRGYIDYGTNIAYSWITPKGQKLIVEI